MREDLKVLDRSVTILLDKNIPNIFYIGMIVTGKYCFKAEEKYVIMLLKHL
jgi:hypothetical protein